MALLTSPHPVLASLGVEGLAERLNRALNAARMVDWEWDLKTGEIHYSDNAPEVLGVPPGPTEMSWEGIHPDDVTNLRRNVDEAVAGRRDFVAKVRFIRPDNGALRWLEIRGHVICKSGAPASISGVTRDISDQEVAEQALRRSEQRFRISQSVAGIAETTPDGQFLTVNDRFCEMVGYRREELLGMTRTEITHPEDLPMHVEKFRHVGDGEPFNIEKRYIRKDGSVIWVHNNVAPISGESGRGYSIVTISVDITARKAAEHELRVHHNELMSQNEELRTAQEQLGASRARYFDLYDLAPVGYLTLSEEGLIREANLTAASLLGVPRGSLPRQRLSRFVLPDDANVYYFLIKNLSRRGGPQNCELRVTRQGAAAPFWARLDATPSVDQDGAPGWRVVISDISGRKQAQQSLRQSEENLRRLVDEIREMNIGLERRVQERTRALEEANRELEAFGYSVSHDLRAPLRALQGFSQALLEDYPAEMPPKSRKFLERIGVAAARMDELIQDLLAYSRMSRAELRLEPLDLSAVVREACQQLQHPIEETKATVEVDPLPVVCGHHGTLVQIFTNLCSNSLKFVSPDVTPHIRISAEPHGSLVRVWVADNGIGIEPEHQQKIFEVFQRLHGLETYPGTGIGWPLSGAAPNAWAAPPVWNRNPGAAAVSGWT